MITIGNPILARAETITRPTTFLAVTDLSGITLTAYETKKVEGLEEALADQRKPYAIIVEHPDTDLLQIYPAQDEEDALELIYDIEYHIAEEIYGG